MLCLMTPVFLLFNPFSFFLFPTCAAPVSSLASFRDWLSIHKRIFSFLSIGMGKARRTGCYFCGHSAMVSVNVDTMGMGRDSGGGLSVFGLIFDFLSPALCSPFV